MRKRMRRERAGSIAVVIKTGQGIPGDQELSLRNPWEPRATGLEEGGYFSSYSSAASECPGEREGEEEWAAGVEGK